MDRIDVISQLESLQGHCGSMRDPDEEEDIWAKDVEALEIAILVLKKEHEEVSV